MSVVARDACRHTRVACRQALAMHARRVLGGLVDALLRCELMHERHVTVTARACGDNLLSRGLPLIAAPCTMSESLVGRGLIASMAVDARKTPLGMDIAREGLCGRGEGRLL